MKISGTFEAPRTHREARDFFDRIADDYARRSRGRLYNTSSLSFRRRQEIVIDLLRTIPSGGITLDYGMGPAVFGATCASHGLRYIGIDFSAAMVDLARAANIPDSEYYAGDLDVLDRFEGSVDTVLLIGVLDYFAEPIAALRRLSRCVRRDGRIILSFRNHRSVPRALWALSRQAWRALRAPERPQTAFEAGFQQNSFVPARDLIPVLEEEGFSRFEIRYLDCSPIFFNVPLDPKTWNAWKRADEILSRPQLSLMCASGVVMASGKR
jgi:SAM-dependent methyltransferase